MNDNTQNMNVSTNNGVTRLTIGAVQADTPIDAPQESRVYGGVTKFQMGPDGGSTQAGVTKYTVGQDAPTGSIVATMKTDCWGPSVELIPGVPGSRTLIATALREGLVERAFDGTFRDKAPASLQDSTGSDGAPVGGPEDAPVDPGEGVFSKVEDDAWAANIQDIPQHAYDAAAALATIAAMTEGGSLDAATRRLSEGGAMSPEDAAVHVSEGVAMYERIVSTEVIAAGIADKEAFYTWMRQEKGNAMRQAIQSLTAMRDVSHFRTLMAEYNRHH